jgi:hypothetical protein
VTPETTVQIACGVLAVLCVVIIIMRRKTKSKQKTDDEF